MDILGSLKLIKECAACIVKEVDSLKTLKKMNTTHLGTYSKAISLLGASVERMLSIFDFKKAPDDVQLKLLLVDFLSIRILQFKEHITEYKEWCCQVERANFITRCCSLLCQSPSKQQQKLEMIFQDCFQSIKEMVALEGSLIGSAIRIKHPILRMVWLEAGQNDLNASEIKVQFVQDSLWKMLRKELKVIKNEAYCKEMIAALVNRLDGSLGSQPDGQLSMMELNEAAKFPKASVAALLGITVERQPDEDSIEMPCEVVFEGPVYAENNCGFDIPAIVGGRYGSEWNNKKVAMLTVPRTDDILFGVKVYLQGNDQGWGNTNQVQIAYIVDKGESQLITRWAMNFNHDTVKDQNYVFTIPAEEVNPGDIISLIMYVPPWNGFSGQVKSVRAVAITKKKEIPPPIPEVSEPKRRSCW